MSSMNKMFIQTSLTHDNFEFPYHFYALVFDSGKLDLGPCLFLCFQFLQIGTYLKFNHFRVPKPKVYLKNPRLLFSNGKKEVISNGEGLLDSLCQKGAVF